MAPAATDVPVEASVPVPAGDPLASLIPSSDPQQASVTAPPPLDDSTPIESTPPVPAGDPLAERIAEPADSPDPGSATPAVPESRSEASEPEDAAAPAADPVDAIQSAPPAEPVPAEAKPARTAASVATESGPAGLSILMVTSELHPFASTGGLAEVAAALPQALAGLGHAATVVLPRYRGIDTDGARAVPLTFALGGRLVALSVLEQRLPNGVLLALVDAPDLFDRDGLYGDAAGDYPDNAWRFAVFSRAALEYARAAGIRPSVIHAHDWQAGLVPVYQKMLFSADPIVGGVPAVFTIHNLAFQGLFPASIVGDIGLEWNVLDVEAMEYWGQVSYLKAGINFSEQITTVSPTYASEITTPELGFGFDGILKRRAADLTGILNGIDTSRWDPAQDAFVPASFTATDLAGKQTAKRALLDVAGLLNGTSASNARVMARPVIGLMSRLTDQKGFDLIAASADELMSLDASWVMLGSGETRYEELWRGLATRHPGRVSATFGFEERLTHFIEAGSDIFLMPSKFEPCGLNQLYSLRYGTLPIVRATGGLKDTVEDAGATGKGTGFVFSQYTPGALVDAVRRALALFRQPELWRAMQRRAMQQDHSWDASAREYVKVYRALTERRRPEPRTQP